MALRPGMRLGPYEVVAPIGSGGMGEVYRAKDTRLDRTVAIKVLPAHVASDPDLKQRFEREARAVSSLNHPHICTLYDVGQQDGMDFLVMEYLEGQTLTERLEKGPLPLDQTLQYAIHIADALDKAHRQGIIHRDLKPRNIMLTKAGAKLLDFGLARIRAGAASMAGGLSALPTEEGLTAQGTILGTLQYMAPEQLEGKEADARTDIFAFGAVVYEMATGKKAFEGKSPPSVISAIMSADPQPISASQPLTPPLLDHIVKRCLAKDPDDRWQAATDVMQELKWTAETGSAALPPMRKVHRGNRERLAWLVAGLFILALLAVLALPVARLREAPAQADPVRFSVFPPQDATFTGGVGLVGLAQAVSPDGRRVVFRAQRAGGPDLLWVRSFDSLEAQALPGTGGGDLPFWSPDSRFIGFFAQGKLKKIEVSGGPPLTLCDAPAGGGGSWNRDGTIVFGTLTAGLSRVSASGGQPAPLTTLDASRKETSHRWPQFLPDGRRFVFRVQPGNGIRVGSLDSKESRSLLNADSKVLYAPPGYVLFVRQGTLMAQAFDVSRTELTGDPFPIAERVDFNGTSGLAAFSVSENGVLAYRMGPSPALQLTWFDRSGKRLESIGQPGDYRDVSLSPDGARVIVHRHEEPSGGGLWLFDLARGTSSRFTFDVSHNDSATWSPDGSRIVFWSDRDGGVRNLYQKIASGAGPDELLLKSSEQKDPTQWSSDGRFIVYVSEGPTGADLWVLPLAGDRKPMPFLRTEFNEGHGRLSPDGRWMAYTSNETGRNEVYGQPFPASGGKWQISTSGGAQPRWRRDGKELYYLAGATGGETAVMAVEARATESTFEVSVPKTLFRTRIARLGANPQTQGLGTATENSYAVTADGQRFLILTPSVAETAQEPITVVLNWTAGLKK